jgi:Zn-dependent peptidase ImmA (M78 family)
MPRVNPDVLRWARETAGLDLDVAARMLGIKDARGVVGVDRLAALESGDDDPSRTLLVKMSQQYRRPLLTFYLPAPPRRAERGEDFRTLPEEYGRRDAALVDVLLRDVRARQEMVRSLLEVEDETSKLTFVDSFNMNDGTKLLAEEITKSLGFSLAQFRRGRRNDAFAYLRELVERQGVFVLLIGNLGSHHSVLDIELFRGIALADPVTPFIVINDQDSEAAWSFTLLHELAHLWIGRTGISGANPSTRIEVFCNDVAGQILMPDGEALREEALRGAGVDQVIARIRQLADSWQVSHSAVNYKLYRQGLISREVWAEVGGIFRRQWLQNRAAAREKDKENENAPSYYVVRRHRLGSRLVGLSARMLAEGILSPSAAGRILGVKPTNVYALTGAPPGASGRAA